MNDIHRSRPRATDLTRVFSRPTIDIADVDAAPSFDPTGVVMIFVALFLDSAAGNFEERRFFNIPDPVTHAEVVFHSNLIGIGFSAIAMLFSGAFYTLVPIRPRRRGERRSLRTFPGASLRPHPAFNTPRPRRLSTPLLTPFNSTPTFARMERPSGELLPAFAHAFANATVLPAICVAALFGYLSVSFIMLLIRHYGASNTEIVKSTRKMISIGASMLLYPAPWNWSGPTVSSSPAPLSSPVNVYLSMTHLALMNARMRPYVLEVRRGVSVHGGGVVRFVSVETAEARRVGGVDRGDEVMIELTKRRR